MDSTNLDRGAPGRELQPGGRVGLHEGRQGVFSTRMALSRSAKARGLKE
jgi:hypothetical protein